MLLSIVMPAYNEQAGIAAVIERVLATRLPLAALDIQLELIIVDDGSRDNTSQIIRRYPDVRLICHTRNQGYGAALKTGFREARGDYLGFLDADGTYPPESLPDLCRAAVAHRADLVIGSRMSGAQSQMPPVRRLGNTLYALLLSLIGNVRVRDTASGMRILRRAILSQLYPLPDGLDFTPAMSTRAIYEDLKIVEVPIPYAERAGNSKLHVVRDGLGFTRTIVWTALTYNPVRILGMIGLLFGGLAVLAAAALALDTFSSGVRLTTMGAYLVFFTLILGVVAVSILTLAVMFSYLIALFTQRPVRRGLFGRVLFDPPLDYQFGWMGAGSMLLGLAINVTAVVLGFRGWPLAEIWFYLLAGALLIIVGLQLAIAWIVMRGLEELSHREAATRRDLTEDTTAAGRASGEPSVTKPVTL